MVVSSYPLAAGAEVAHEAAAPVEDREKRIYLEQVTLLYQQAIPAAFVNVSVGVVIAMAFWNQVPRWAVATWSSLVAFSSLFACSLIYRHHKATVTVDNARVWGRLRTLETFMTGVAWGSASLLLMPFAPFTYQAMVVVLIAGFASGAIPVNAVRLEVYLAYVVPLCVPLLYTLLARPGVMNVLGTATIPFFLSMMVTAHRLAQRTDSSLRLQFENYSLARDLTYEIAERRRAEEKLLLKSKIDELTDSLQQRNVALVDALRRAEEAAKVKSQFLANMSHELRTPLNSIINIPEGLEEDFVNREVVRCEGCEALFEPEEGDEITSSSACPSCGAVGKLAPHVHETYAGDPARTRKYLRSIHQCGKHLLDVISDVLDFSKMEAGKLVLRVQLLQLGAVFADLRSGLGPLADAKKISLVIPDVPPDFVLEADRVKLVQILTNLIGNAVKFSGEGTTVDVRVAKGPTSYTLSVRDQGIGIATEDQELVFEAFRQVDGGHTRKYGGSGLGLTISRDLVHLHGGRMWLESALGVGTTFFVELPMSSGAALHESGAMRSRRKIAVAARTEGKDEAH